LLELGYVIFLVLFLDENSIRDADIFPSSPEIERGSTLKLFCVLGKRYTPHRNASHIIWKLNHELIAQENYSIVNETRVLSLSLLLCLLSSLANFSFLQGGFPL
uniref:Immunoglobulin C2-set-like ligand-binding domain-containing protein n=1 Tax=Strix occidentalis caurina TaxID=311401 RepID=A0A8D0F1S9_STROC